MLSKDIRLARQLFLQIPRYPALQPFTHSLSITTFRFVPTDLDPTDQNAAPYLDDIIANSSPNCKTAAKLTSPTQ